MRFLPMLTMLVSIFIAPLALACGDADEELAANRARVEAEVASMNDRIGKFMEPDARFISTAINRCPNSPYQTTFQIDYGRVGATWQRIVMRFPQYVCAQTSDGLLQAYPGAPEGLLIAADQINYEIWEMMDSNKYEFNGLPDGMKACETNM